MDLLPEDRTLGSFRLKAEATGQLGDIESAGLTSNQVG